MNETTIKLFASLKLIYESFNDMNKKNVKIWLNIHPHSVNSFYFDKKNCTNIFYCYCENIAHFACTRHQMCILEQLIAFPLCHLRYELLTTYKKKKKTPNLCRDKPRGKKRTENKYELRHVSMKMLKKR